MATRVAVPGPAAVDTIEGPLLQVASSVSALFLFGAQEQGTDPAAGGAAS